MTARSGLPPARDELAAFLADRASDATERYVRRLLASPHFGERWARMWLDLARFADSTGYGQDNLRPFLWRYRDWVIDAFDRNLPFDRFTIEQLRRQAAAVEHVEDCGGVATQPLREADQHRVLPNHPQRQQRPVVGRGHRREDEEGEDEGCLQGQAEGHEEEGGPQEEVARHDLQSVLRPPVLAERRSRMFITCRAGPGGDCGEAAPGPQCRCRADRETGMKRSVRISFVLAAGALLLGVQGAPARAEKCLKVGGWGTGALEGFASFMAEAAMKNAAATSSRPAYQ